MDGYSGFLYLDKDGMPEVAMHWQHRFNHLGLEDAQNEMVRLEELNRAKEEVAKAAGEKKPLTQRSFRAV